ncbi:Probable WRKY transcription factor 49, partial [Linum perenne]
FIYSTTNSFSPSLPPLHIANLLISLTLIGLHLHSFLMADDELTTTWFDGSFDSFLPEEDHDDLFLRELFYNDDDSPFCFQPQSSNPILNHQTSLAQFLLSTLPLSHDKPQQQPESVPISRVGSFEKGINRIDSNKYTLKLKCCDTNWMTVADDGYKWRKYGQKSIKNSPYPRSYYKCTNPRCNAKKQVERSRDEKDTLIITYEGLHLHFAYPYIPLGVDTSVKECPPPSKRPRLTSPEEGSLEQNDKDKEEEMSTDAAPQGMLEDLVPLVIRNPTKKNLSPVSCVNGGARDAHCNVGCNSSSCSSHWSSVSLASSPSSLSWSSPESHLF